MKRLIVKKIDYGPLANLIGTWKGDKGLDVAPAPSGCEENPYCETITYVAVGDVTNAKSQKLAVIRYQQIVRRKSDDEIFHDETGYWMWDADNNIIMHSLVIPRSVCVLAGGGWTGNECQGKNIEIYVSAKLNDPDWGILQSPFMRNKVKTVEFRHKISVNNEKLVYSETTVLEIYGKTFEHIDHNELLRCKLI